MDNINEKIYTKITAIIMVVLTVVITGFAFYTISELRQVRDGINNLRGLEQLRYESSHIADGIIDIK